MDEIGEEFLQLVKITQNLQQRVADLEKSNQVLIRSNKQLVEWVQDTIEELQDYKENARFELQDEIETNQDYWFPHIERGQIAIERIIKDGCSMARFGDGEFAVIEGRIRHKFQTEEDDNLTKRLKEVLQNPQENLLIGIADNYGSLERYNDQAKREIRRYLKREVRKEHLSLLNKNVVYYDAYVTRPYVMYADNMTNAPIQRFENLKKIWNNKKCVFVEGKQTRLGVGNDLFQNTKSIKRILAPAENAFEAYNKILEECLKQGKENLFLLALGPTATVLAYDLCRQGFQAIDVGHVDLEYEWFLRGEGHRTYVEGKYNNELNGGEHPADIKDPWYEAQIVADISERGVYN